MSERVLVTGGAGLIGSHVVDRLLHEGHEVTLLDSLLPEIHPGGAPDWIPEQARLVVGDVRDPDALDHALTDCRGVIHLAAWGGFSADFARILDINATGTARLFEAVRRSGRIERVVTASSMAVYGEGWYRCPQHGPFRGAPREAARLARRLWEVVCAECGRPAVAHPIPGGSTARPSGAYAISKFAAERLTLGEGRELGIGAVALRYFLTYGPRQSVHNAYSGIAAIFATRLLHDLSPVVYEDGLQTRDLIHVEDVARATVLAYREPRAAGRVFDVARGESVTIAGFARQLARACGVAIEPELPGRYRPQDNRHMLGDAAALRELGWEPQVSLASGIDSMVAWTREAAGEAGTFSRVEAELRRAGVVRESGGELD